MLVFKAGSTGPCLQSTACGTASTLCFRVLELPAKLSSYCVDDARTAFFAFLFVLSIVVDPVLDMTFEYGDSFNLFNLA